jgi:hypothetical protein
MESAVKFYGRIDPGKTGAIALVSELATASVWDWEDMAGLGYLRSLDVSKVLIEKQQAFPKQGVSSVFKLGVNYGQWLGRLECSILDEAWGEAKKKMR